MRLFKRRRSRSFRLIKRKRRKSVKTMLFGRRGRGRRRQWTGFGMKGG